VLPPAVARGAAAEKRYTPGLAIVSGMLGLTLPGSVFTPGFHVMIRWPTDRGRVASVPTPLPVRPDGPAAPPGNGLAAASATVIQCKPGHHDL
jgi:hypothetical protein